MLHRDLDFDEDALAYKARDYISMFLRKESDQVCYVPYKDVPSGQTKYVKFVKVLATWVYVGNSQFANS
jgi:peptidase E